ncbi:MAG: CRISPR-associated helicase Cas3' [Labilithrix sp.]|nr:CRISPR-associated helicase Cas3' [Labilithrix sp.]MCW5816353.1 CRISPR-associated helicase Cas3' [Labilithrix sp.]
MLDFDRYFKRLAEGAAPREWQRSLGAESRPRSRLVRVPTGMGKTLGVLAAWLWHRVERRDDAWPRRLVWCLPMRVLVEQTEDVVRAGVERLGILWDDTGEHAGRVGVHVLMGGADPGAEWALFPEEHAVLIGTQDMLLSRALNRGYAAARARWPLEYGLLNHDALWVMDEVQLMDVGLATSGQLQAFADEDGGKGLRPRHTWWMSATLQPRWLETIDTRERCETEWHQDPAVVAPSELTQGIAAVRKTLDLEVTPAADAKEFADRIMKEHAGIRDGDHGRITLVVCNTVERACRTYDELRARAPEQELELVHSRFRPAERATWRERFLRRDACTHGADRIVVATQVVEAGVDISAGCVVTELSPWPSLVQRFGRCARYGGEGRVVVVDRGHDEKTAAPYDADELAASWSSLGRVGVGGDVGIATLEAFEAQLDAGERALLYPFAPRHLFLRRERDELFDTTPDLTGADLDVSRFIRSGDERDLQVFWLGIPRDRRGAPRHAPSPRRRPRREELCSIPFLRARDWLCGAETTTRRKPKLRSGVRAWVWDWLDGAWMIAERSLLTPGRVVCVAADAGGYRVERGFDPTWNGAVPVVPEAALASHLEAELQADDADDADDVSVAEWKTIAIHVGEAAAIADEIAAHVELRPELRRLLVLAARWHDVGKAHPAFQGGIRASDRPRRQDLAKAPKAAWPRPPQTYRSSDDRDVRPGLRHELASALALFAVVRRHAPRHAALLGPWSETFERLGVAPVGALPVSPPTACEEEILACSADDFDLLAYLVASHHGKVRLAFHASPRDQEYRDRDGRGLPIRGIRDGDELAPVLLDATKPPLPALALSLEPATLGLSPTTGRSWRERTSALVDRLGPSALAWLEALLIAADRRASRLVTADPLLSAVEAG